MVVREAGRGDEEGLIRLRLEFLEEDDGPIDRSLRETVTKQMTDFIPEHLGKDFFAFLLEEQGMIVSTVFLREEHAPANRRFLTGITGTLYNVYTRKEWRRKGYAGILVKKPSTKVGNGTIPSSSCRHRRVEPLCTRHLVSPIRPLPMNR